MALYGEIGRYPLYISRYVRIIKYWIKIVKSENVIVNMFYKDMVDKANIGIKNWASQVKYLLDSYGFSYVWDMQFNYDVPDICIDFKQRIVDDFLQHWKFIIESSRSLIMYRSVKEVFGCEYYLDLLPKQLYINLARLRLSSHQLRIQTGRYVQNYVERRQRFCILCTSNEIEDEYHFILECNIYVTIRRKYISQYFYIRPNMYKFCQLLKSHDKTTLYKLSRYINEAFDIRKALN